jgi:hypothetical protein
LWVNEEESRLRGGEEEKGILLYFISRERQDALRIRKQGSCGEERRCLERKGGRMNRDMRAGEDLKQREGGVDYFISNCLYLYQLVCSDSAIHSSAQHGYFED